MPNLVARDKLIFQAYLEERNRRFLNTKDVIDDIQTLHDRPIIISKGPKKQELYIMHYKGEPKDKKIVKYFKGRDFAVFKREVLNLYKVWRYRGCQKIFSTSPKNLMMVSEYAGRNLSAIIRNKRTYSSSGILCIAHQITTLVCELVDNGYLHNNIKAENICILEQRATLMDFKTMTRHNAKVLRNPDLIPESKFNLAPEILRGGRCTEKSEVFSLCRLISDMLCKIKRDRFPNLEVALTAGMSPEAVNRPWLRTIEKEVQRALSISKGKRVAELPPIDKLFSLVDYDTVKVMVLDHMELPDWTPDTDETNPQENEEITAKIRQEIFDKWRLPMAFEGRLLGYIYRFPPESVIDKLTYPMAVENTGISYIAEIEGKTCVVKQYDTKNNMLYAREIVNLQKLVGIKGSQEVLGIVPDYGLIVTVFCGQPMKEWINNTNMNIIHWYTVLYHLFMAVSDLNGANIGHNDISLTNICIDKDLRVTLTNFLISAEFGQRVFMFPLTKKEREKLPHAPEVLKGGRCSKKSEVYSVGMVILSLHDSVGLESARLLKWSYDAYQIRHDTNPGPMCDQLKNPPKLRSTEESSPGWVGERVFS
ncbi:hypothetical protein SK128_025496 [Halocaridina rubra]|uniref:Protein kinase domain-containing protein n=1 Tax=Halocaridina rubra TaxID=373956 RepID=A0AAN8WUU0_HALRR